MGPVRSPWLTLPWFHGPFYSPTILARGQVILFLRFILFLIVCIMIRYIWLCVVCMWVFVHVCTYIFDYVFCLWVCTQSAVPRRLEPGIRSPKAEVRGGWETPTWVLESKSGLLPVKCVSLRAEPLPIPWDMFFSICPLVSFHMLSLGQPTGLIFFFCPHFTQSCAIRAFLCSQLTCRSRCQHTVCTYTGTPAPCFLLLWAQTRAGLQQWIVMLANGNVRKVRNRWVQVLA